MKSKKLVISLVVVVLIFGGGYLFLKSRVIPEVKDTFQAAKSGAMDESSKARLMMMGKVQKALEMIQKLPPEERAKALIELRKNILMQQGQSVKPSPQPAEGTAPSAAPQGQ